MQSPLCLYHSPCADGFTAAWVVKQAIPTCEFMPAAYDKAIDPGKIAGRNIIMVDFSVKKPELEKWNRLASSVLILDHHKTAQAELSGYLHAPQLAEWRKIAWNDLPMPPGTRVAVQFDMARSGAQMAWDYFNANAPRPPLVDYVGDRDLWKFALPNSRLVNQFVFSFPYSFDNWDMIHRQLVASDGIRNASMLGAAIDRKHHKDVAEMLDVTARTMMIAGHEMPVANLPYTMASDAAKFLAERSPLKMGATYYDSPDGRVFSLRSTEDGPDVSAIALTYGGGGHKNAAGFVRALGWEGDNAYA